jgi:hypothetical protein
MTDAIPAEQVIRYRAAVQHLDAKLPRTAIARAAWGGLQDSIPRSGVLSLHARVKDTRPDDWEHPDLVQIWFRSGADYIVPREEVGIFTLGALPRNTEAAARLERLADAIHAATEGRTLPVGDAVALLQPLDDMTPRFASPTGRVHIRWDASRIWLIPADRPSIDPEDARRELARRFIRWFGPTTRPPMQRWTGTTTSDARETWRALEPELVAVRLAGETDDRYVLAAELDHLRGAKELEGVRLLPFDDPLTKVDPDLLVPNAAERERVVPARSRGFIPGAVLVDGEVVGVWQRQQRKSTIHPWRSLPSRVRDAIEAEALAFPIAGTAAPTVAWETP